MSYKEDRESISIEVVDDFVRLLWIKDIGKNKRKKIKESLLEEFAGKLVIDYRRNGASFIMNDMIAVIGEEDIQTILNELVTTFTRTRGGSVEWRGAEQVVLSCAEVLMGTLTISVFKGSRKVMAQGDQTPLKHFITLYSSTIMRMRGSATIPHRTISLVGQELDISDEMLANSQEQSEPDDIPEDGVMATLQTDELPIDQVPTIPEASPVNNTVTSDNLPVSNPSSNEIEIEVDRLSSIDPTVCVNQENVKVDTFTCFTQSIMVQLSSLVEGQKEIMTKLPQISQLTERMDAIELQNRNAQAELSARTLILEEESRELKAELEKVKSNQKSNSLALNVLRNDMSSSTSAVSSDVFNALSSSVKEIMNTAQVRENKRSVELVSLATSLKKLQEEVATNCATITNLQKQLFSTGEQSRSQSEVTSGPVLAQRQCENRLSPPMPDTRPTESQDVRLSPPTKFPRKKNQQHDVTTPVYLARPAAENKKGAPDSNHSTTSSQQPPSSRNCRQGFDADVLLFMDSNGKDIREDILKHGTRVEKIWSARIADATKIIRSSSFARAPSQIYFHVGTNDLEYASPAQIIKDFESLLQVTKTKFPSTEIFVSEILPRWDFYDERCETNDRLHKLLYRLEVIVVRHSLNIDDTMLFDRKHLNKKGFYRMLANIRYFIFGIWKPRYSREQESHP